MRTVFIILILVIFISAQGCTNQQERIPVKTGADILLTEKLDLLHGKNIAIVTNHTGVLSNGVHLVDALNEIESIHIKVLFGPEHGIRGDAPDGLTIQDGLDAKLRVPVYSLYGKTRKPTAEMLKGANIIIFDIQDIGARFYTYISTLYYVIEAAAENNIPLIVLDRPNPIGGLNLDGPLRPDKFKSFVAIAPIPIMHGMTIGELAQMFNEEKFITTEKKARIKVIKMKNWKREYYYDECGIPWVKPSPNMVNLNTAIVYPGLCLIEGTNVSEGRGTNEPFTNIGAPYVEADELISSLDKKYNDGLKLSPVEFTPVEIPNMSSNPKYKSEKCQGIKIEIEDRSIFQPVKFGVDLINTLNELYPKDFTFRKSSIDRLFGNEYLREMIIEKKTTEEIISIWESELVEFKKLRKKYLLY